MNCDDISFGGLLVTTSNTKFLAFSPTTELTWKICLLCFHSNIWTLILSCIMLKNGQAYFKNLAVMFGHFSTLSMKFLSDFYRNDSLLNIIYLLSYSNIICFAQVIYWIDTLFDIGFRGWKVTRSNAAWNCWHCRINYHLDLLVCKSCSIVGRIGNSFFFSSQTYLAVW